MFTEVVVEERMGKVETAYNYFVTDTAKLSNLIPAQVQKLKSFEDEIERKFKTLKAQSQTILSEDPETQRIWHTECGKFTTRTYEILSITDKW